MLKRTLRVSGVNLVRVGSLKYRFNVYGEKFTTCMWGRAQ
ncbi:hypothetical protein DEDE109153_13305 [Deinococcus deserti]